MKKTIVLLLMILSFKTMAKVKFAPQLIKLDPKKSTSELIVINESNKDSVYEVKLVPPPYKISGNNKDEFSELNKAIRFSPKRFTVKSNSSQKVRVIMRKNQKLLGPYLLYVKLSPVYDPTKAEKGSVAILQDFVFPLYTFFKTEDFKVKIESAKLSKESIDIKYSGVERTPTRAKFHILDKENKIVLESTLVFKDKSGVVNKPYPKDFNKDGSHKIIFKSFIGEKVFHESNL